MTTKKIILSIILSLVTALILANVVSAKHYVSFNGKFYITYPDDWQQIDYNTVDAYLLQFGASEASLRYEAVFAPEASDPFFDGSYLILNVDTVGEFDQHSIDSVFAELQSVFGKGKKYFPVRDLKQNLKSSSPVYNEKTKTITVLNDIVHEGFPPLKNLLAMKFYEHGVASFYFYTRDSLYAPSRKMFIQIVQSLDTENIEGALEKETLTLARVEDRELKTSDLVEQEKTGKKSKTGFNVAIFVALIVVIIVVTRRKKKKQALPENKFGKGL